MLKQHCLCREKALVRAIAAVGLVGRRYEYRLKVGKDYAEDAVVFVHDAGAEIQTLTSKNERPQPVELERITECVLGTTQKITVIRIVDVDPTVAKVTNPERPLHNL